MLSRPWIVAFGILAIGGMVTWAYPPIASGKFWTGLLAVAVGAGVYTWLDARFRRRAAAGGGGRRGPWVVRGEFLCDSCKYDHPDLCSRRERPNAVQCDDYRERG